MPARLISSTETRRRATSLASTSADDAPAVAHAPARPSGRQGSDHYILDRILARRELRAVYQPIIDLGSGTVAGFEALARGPRGSVLESPGALFDAARRAGRLNELEWACRAAALEGALDAELGTRHTLFVNVEPRVLGKGIPPHLDKLFRAAERKLRIVLELTERDLTRQPAELLHLVAWARERWWGVALDDVGAEEESLALLPLVEPDVVKLDMRLVQDELTPDDEAVVEAVRLHAARTGASVLAEGIETDAHVDVARALGADLGQGWHYGRPGDIEPAPGRTAAVRLLPAVTRHRAESPFEIIAAESGSERGDLDTLTRVRTRMEDRVLVVGRPSLVLASFGAATQLTPELQARYSDLADRCTFVAVSGVDMPPVPAPGVRGITLDDRDPLAGEHTFVVVGPDVAEAVSARVHGSRPGTELEIASTDDRAAVLAVAKLLMSRVVAATRG